MIEQDIGIQTAADAITSANREANKQFVKKTFESGLRVAAATAIIEAGVACTPAPVHENDPNVGLTSIPGETMTPPATEAPVSTTGTPIVEVTQAAPEIPVDELVTSFNLKETPGYENRTFDKQTINGVEYVVDGYNGAPKLVNENGTWRELDYHSTVDADAMYGKMVQTGGVYILPDEITMKHGPNIMLIHPIILGDWEVGKADYQGKQIDMYYILAGLRGKDGNLDVVRLAYDSPNTDHQHLSTIWCVYETGKMFVPGNGKQSDGQLEDQLKQLKPGEVTGITIPMGESVPSVEYYAPPGFPELNNMQWVMMTDLNNQHPELYQLTADEQSALKQGQWPDRLVTLALLNGGPAVRRTSEADCK